MTPDSLTRTFAALAHPARRAMLARLGQGEASVQELSRPLKLSGPAVTKHLKVLEASGLITRSRRAQFRPCRLQAAPMKEAADWIEQYRREWEARLDRLQEYLHELQTAAPARGADTPKKEKP